MDIKTLFSRIKLFLGCAVLENNENFYCKGAFMLWVEARLSHQEKQEAVEKTHKTYETKSVGYRELLMVENWVASGFFRVINCIMLASKTIK